MRPHHPHYDTDQPSFADLLFYPQPNEEEAALHESPTRPPLDVLEAPAGNVDLTISTLPVFGVQLVREGEFALPEPVSIHAPKDAVTVFSEYLKDKDREYFVSLMLDSKNRVRGIHTVSIGILDSALVHPREVFKAAILCNSASVILCHNHPSGDATPSLEDRRVTERLVQAGKILGIDVMDHLVIGEKGSFTSLKQFGVF